MQIVKNTVANNVAYAFSIDGKFDFPLKQRKRIKHVKAFG